MTPIPEDFGDNRKNKMQKKQIDKLLAKINEVVTLKLSLFDSISIFMGIHFADS